MSNATVRAVDASKPTGDAPRLARGRPPKQNAEIRTAVTREAQCMATGILEVLAGIRTPTEAAAALGISVPRYYLLEQRALAGLISACEKRPIGRGCSPQRRIAALEKENVKLRQDCTRQQALVRVAQRTIGLPAPPTKPVVKAGGKGNEKFKRKRRPMVRALKAVAALREAPIADDSPGVSSSSNGPEVVQRNAVSAPTRSPEPVLVPTLGTEC
jgi:hypothetical protein